MRIRDWSATMLIAMLVVGSHRAQVVIQVPTASYPTIQSGIVAAAPGSTVLVAPGTYFENIDFLGKVITVKGAGPGQSIIDGNQQGSVVTFKSYETSQSILDGFTIRNGSGTWLSYIVGGYYVGGGLYIKRGPLGEFPQPTIRHCEITANQSTEGGAAYCDTVVAFEDCHVHANVGTPYPAAPAIPGLGGIRIALTTTYVSMWRCVVENNTYIGLGTSGAGELHDCIFRYNSGFGALLGLIPTTLGNHVVERCQFIGNSNGGIGGGLKVGGNSGAQVRDCVFAGNQASGAAGIYIREGSNIDIINCTIIGNATGLPYAPGAELLCPGGTGPGIYINVSNSFSVPTVRVRNCIIRDNVGGPQIDYCNFFNVPPILSVDTCNIQGGWTGAGSGNFDLTPLFRDPANHDYHLIPGSPCIDAGTTTGLQSTTDFEGDPRLVHGAVDVGADEASIGNHPAMQSRVGASLGGPYDVLLANGSAGSASHRVVAAQGQSGQISVVLAPPSTGSPRFLVWGQLGEPAFSDVVNLPFGLGPMAVIPCPLLPSYQPLLFTLVDNFGPDPCPPLLPSTPAPWTSGPLPPVFFPLTLTLQGLYETLPGQIEVTNGIIYEIR